MANEVYVHIAVGSIIIILNITELVLIIKARKSIKPYEQLLSSLACADLLTGVLLTVFKLYILFDNSQAALNIEANILFCLVLTTVMISIATLTSITIDRLIAVKYPLAHRVHVTKKRVWICAVTEWILTWLLVTIPILLGKFQLVSADNMSAIYSTVTAWIALSCGPAFVLGYAEIIRSVWKKPASISSQGLRRNDNNSQDKTVALTCLLVVLTYLICTIPFAARILMGKKPLDEWSGIVLFCNSIANPIVYFFKGYLKKKSQQKARGDKVQCRNDDKAKTTTDSTRFQILESKKEQHSCESVAEMQ